MDIVKLVMSAPQTDLIVAVLLLLGAILYSLSLGRERIMCILLSVYIALALVAYAPIVSFLGRLTGKQQDPFYSLVIFSVLCLSVLGFLTYSGALRGLGSHRLGLSWMQSLVVSFFQVGLIASVVINLLPAGLVAGLTAQTKLLFMSEYGRSAWLILPDVSLAILANRRSEPEFVEDEE